MISQENFYPISSNFAHMSTLIQRQTNLILVVKGQGQRDVTSIHSSYCEHDISQTPGGNFLQIWHKCPFGVTDELNGICWSKVKGHRDFMQHIFGLAQ